MANVRHWTRGRLLGGAALVLCALAACAGRAAAGPALQAGADSSSAYVERAREAAAADRHREAIGLYRRAIELDPSLRAELGKELGLQYTWNDEPREALPWFRRYLAEQPEDDEALLGYARALSWADSLGASLDVYRRVVARSPENVEARLGEARVTAWMGDNAGAKALYRAVLASNPANADARLGLAQIDLWQEKYREARDQYQSILRDHPANADALVGLAAAERGLGMNNRSRSLLDRAAGAAGAGTELRDIEREEASTAKVAYGVSRDSDKLVIHTVEGSGSVFAGDLTSFGLSFTRFTMLQNDRPAVAAYVVTGRFYRRINEDWALHLNAAPLWSSFDLAAADPALGLGPGRHAFNPFTWDGWLTWTPRRRLRVDVSGARAAVETPLSFVKAIVYDAAGIGADVTMTERITARGGYDIRSYSDGNERNAWSSELAFLLLRRPVELSAAPGYTGFTFSKSRQNGYFDPARYDNLGLSATARAAFLRVARATVAGRVSAERETGGPFFAVGVIDVTLESDVGEHAAAGAEFFASNSRIAGEAGYSRILGGVYLSFRF